ncbi:MAG TPA: hypothetical protein PLG20_09820, partial [Candidatus Syntrophosphaera sp.]|nr:hypothetical protein [Candidatus Syntrophosphaera sp.]
CSGNGTQDGDQIGAGASASRTGIRRQCLINNIRARGLEPADVQAFATYYGMPLSERALQLYLAQHADKSNPVLEARVAAQKRQINYVEQSHFRHRSNLSAAEIAQMSDEELEAYQKHMMEKASQE